MIAITINVEMTIVMIYKGTDITKRFFKSGPVFNRKGHMPNRRHITNENANLEFKELWKNISNILELNQIDFPSSG